MLKGHFRETNISKAKMDEYFAFFDKRIKNLNVKPQIKYIRLGNKIVRIESYIPELTAVMEMQLSYCLIDKADSYDSILYLWKDDVKSYIADFAQEADNLFYFPKDQPNTFIKFRLYDDSMIAYNQELKTCYSSMNDVSTTAIRKLGHVLAKELYQLAKAPNQSLVHAASVGIDGSGVLISARGGGGKSTLSLSAMLEGFQYVSDDYLVLSKTSEGVYTYPLYSIINLYPQMLERMKSLKAEYMYNIPWRPDKWALDIRAHHDSFVPKLKVDAVIFPKVCNLDKPFIEPAEKGKAIVQLVHSTILQLDYDDDKNNNTVRTLLSLVSNLEFFQINLSWDLNANVELLKQFITKRKLCME